MVDCLPGCDLVDTDDRGCGGTCECPEVKPRELGETCGYVFGLGYAGDCAEGLTCACVGMCANPWIADYPSTCVEEVVVVTCPDTSDCRECLAVSSCTMSMGICATECPMDV